MNREQEIQAEIQILAAECEAIRSRRMWKCPHCEKRTQIAKLTIIQDHFYISPHGCTGGDYWSMSDEVFIPCPKCEFVVRICKDFVQVRETSPIISYNDDEMYLYVKGHQRYFNERLDYYGKHAPSYTEIDEIREKDQERRRRY